MSKFRKKITMFIVASIIFSQLNLVNADSNAKDRRITIEEIDKAISYIYFNDSDYRTMERVMEHLFFVEKSEESLLDHSYKLLNYYWNEVIDESSCQNETENGSLIASEGNIIIRSSYVNFKGIIYAPNGTVTIESSTFNMEGRIIAKDIVYKGSVLTVNSYDGDLELLK